MSPPVFALSLWQVTQYSRQRCAFCDECGALLADRWCEHQTRCASSAMPPIVMSFFMDYLLPGAADAGVFPIRLSTARSYSAC